MQYAKNINVTTLLNIENQIREAVKRIRAKIWDAQLVRKTK